MTSTSTETASNPKPLSLRRKLLKSVTSLAITAVFVAGAGVLIWQGSTVISDRAAAVEAPAPAEPILVSTMTVQMQDSYTVERSFTGQIEAPQTVALAFEQGGTLKSVAFDEGQKVRAGQVIATLGDRLLQTERQRLLASKAALEAQRELIELDNERAAQLNKQGFASTRSLDQSRLGLVEIRARMAELDAAVAAIDVQLDKLTITAPFSGTVNTREFDPGSTIGGGQPVLTIIDDDLPVFRVGMVPALADTLPLNEVLSVDFGEQEVGAKVIAKLPQLDPITRTKAVRLQLTEPADIAFGATGKLTVEETIKSNGAWIPITAIEEGVRGLWTVKTVSDEDTPSVEVEAVELIHAETQRAFVRGTFPADTKIIVDGLHRTVVGQPVRLQ